MRRFSPCPSREDRHQQFFFGQQIPQLKSSSGGGRSMSFRSQNNFPLVGFPEYRHFSTLQQPPRLNSLSIAHHRSFSFSLEGQNKNLQPQQKQINSLKPAKKMLIRRESMRESGPYCTIDRKPSPKIKTRKFGAAKRETTAPAAAENNYVGSGDPSDDETYEYSIYEPPPNRSKSAMSQFPLPLEKIPPPPKIDLPQPPKEKTPKIIDTKNPKFETVKMPPSVKMARHSKKPRRHQSGECAIACLIIFIIALVLLFSVFVTFWWSQHYLEKVSSARSHQLPPHSQNPHNQQNLSFSHANTLTSSSSTRMILSVQSKTTPNATPEDPMETTTYATTEKTKPSTTTKTVSSSSSTTYFMPQKTTLTGRSSTRGHLIDESENYAYADENQLFGFSPAVDDLETKMVESRDPFSFSHTTKKQRQWVSKKHKVEPPEVLIEPSHLYRMLLTNGSQQHKIRVFKIVSNEQKMERSHGIPSSKLIFLNSLAVNGVPVHPLQIQRLLRWYGVDNDTNIIVYDQHPQNIYAFYAFWILKLYGVESISVLNGGLQNWRKFIDNQLIDNGTLTRVVSRHSEAHRGNFIASWLSQKNTLFTFDDVMANFDNHHFDIIDGQTVEEFNGNISANNDQRNPLTYGHIKNAINVPVEALQKRMSDGTSSWLSLNEQASIFHDKGLSPKRPVIIYDGTSYRAAAIWFFMHHLNYDAGVYFGSWPEWLIKAPDNFKVIKRQT